MPRKFNGAADYVSVPKIGSYCDVTIDTWIKFGQNSLEPNCASLGAGWTLISPGGSQMVECPAGTFSGFSEMEPYCILRGTPQPPSFLQVANQCQRTPQINHPIMNEDNWDEGDLHYQIYNGEFGFDINGNGDYTWKWQPGQGVSGMRPNQWYYITVIYSCADHIYHLKVSTPAEEQPTGGRGMPDASGLQVVTEEDYRPEGFCGPNAPVGSCAVQAAAAKWAMITFDSPRIGAWWHAAPFGIGGAAACGQTASYGSQIKRALDGEIYEFKVFSYQKHQCHHCTHCYGAGTPGMELSYTFSTDHENKIPDLSGNGRDGAAQCDGSDQSHCVGTARPGHVTCTVPGFGGYFDGEADYVDLPKLTRADGLGAEYPDLQIDVWVKFHCTTGNHPIMNEQGWTTGDLHYQIYDGEFGFDINGNGDYTFQWQPPTYEWVYISVFYSSEQQTYKLWVETAAGEHIAEVYNPERTYERDHVGFHEDAEKGWVPVILDSPRIGGWQGNSGEVARSMDGQMSVFRVWSSEQGGQDTCPCSKARNLEAYYVFGESSQTLRDLNGNHDGMIVGGKFGEDEPLSECVKELRGLAKNTKLTEHCMEEDGMDFGAFPRIFLVLTLIMGVAFGGK